jgi:hypothetical protein
MQLSFCVSYYSAQSAGATMTPAVGVGDCVLGWMVETAEFYWPLLKTSSNQQLQHATLPCSFVALGTIG